MGPQRDFRRGDCGEGDRDQHSGAPLHAENMHRRDRHGPCRWTACRQRSAWWIPVLRFLCAQRDFLTDDEIDVAGEVASSPRHLLWLPAGRGAGTPASSRGSRLLLSYRRAPSIPRGDRRSQDRPLRGRGCYSAQGRQSCCASGWILPSIRSPTPRYSPVRRESRCSGTPCCMTTSGRS